MIDLEDLEAKAKAATPGPVAEELVRFCPGCGSVGYTPDEFHDCCPDGDKARLIPKPLAEHCHELFVLALKGAAEPSGDPAVEQLDRQEAQKWKGKGQSICIEVLADTSILRRQIAILSDAADKMDALARRAQPDCSVLPESDPAPQSFSAPQTDPMADLILEVGRLRKDAERWQAVCDPSSPVGLTAWNNRRSEWQGVSPETAKQLLDDYLADKEAQS